MKENGIPKYEILKVISPKMMMQEHFYALYVLTVQSTVIVEWQPPSLLVDFEDLPCPGKVLCTPFLHQNDRTECPGSY